MSGRTWVLVAIILLALVGLAGGSNGLVGRMLPNTPAVADTLRLLDPLDWSRDSVALQRSR